MIERDYDDDHEWYARDAMEAALDEDREAALDSAREQARAELLAEQAAAAAALVPRRQPGRPGQHISGCNTAQAREICAEIRRLMTEGTPDATIAAEIGNRLVAIRGKQYKQPDSDDLRRWKGWYLDARHTSTE
jgi:hypothetical protein